MAEIEQVVLVDSHLKALRRSKRPLAWLKPCLSSYHPLAADSHPQTTLGSEGFEFRSVTP